MSAATIANRPSSFSHVSHTEPLDYRLITTADAARLLQVTRFGVHYLARSGQLPHKVMLSGQRYFQYGLVMQLVAKRAAARVQRRGQLLAAVRTRMLKAGPRGDGRQLTLRLVESRAKERKIA